MLPAHAWKIQRPYPDDATPAGPTSNRPTATARTPSKRVVPLTQERRLVAHNTVSRTLGPPSGCDERVEPLASNRRTAALRRRTEPPSVRPGERSSKRSPSAVIVVTFEDFTNNLRVRLADPPDLAHRRQHPQIRHYTLRTPHNQHTNIGSSQPPPSNISCCRQPTICSRSHEYGVPSDRPECGRRPKLTVVLPNHIPVDPWCRENALSLFHRTGRHAQR